MIRLHIGRLLTSTPLLKFDEGLTRGAGGRRSNAAFPWPCEILSDMGIPAEATICSSGCATGVSACLDLPIRKVVEGHGVMRILKNGFMDSHRDGSRAILPMSGITRTGSR